MTGTWKVRLVCCGHDDGYQICATAADAHALRDAYIAADDHERIGVVERTIAPLKLGYRGPRP